MYPEFHGRGDQHSNDEHDFREGNPSVAVGIILAAFIFVMGFALGAWVF
jgi:hypothetical protein